MVYKVFWCSLMSSMGWYFTSKSSNRSFIKQVLGSLENLKIHQNGMRLNHDFYVVVGKQCSTENAYDESPIRYIYIDWLMFFYLVMKLIKFCWFCNSFSFSKKIVLLC